MPSSAISSSIPISLRGIGQSYPSLLARSLVVAVKPQQRCRFWFEFDPGGLDKAIVDDLQERLRELPVPVVHGPVAMAFHAVLWGGPSSGEPRWPFVPKEWLEVARPGLLVPDGILDIIWRD